MTLDWNDLKIALAVNEHGTFARAAKALQLDETTVGRRIAILQRDLGAQLFERNRRGYVVTATGREVLATANPIADTLTQMQGRIQGADQVLRGTVRVTMPDSLATHLVMPQLAAFYAQHPEIRLEFVTTARILNIQKHEADIAIRMLKPTQGSVFARRLGAIQFAGYGSRAYLRRSKPPHTFIELLAANTTAAEQRLVAKLQPKTTAARLQVSNRHAVLAAVEAGLGVGLLPTYVVRGNGLVQVPTIDPVAVDVWLVVHDALKRNARVRTVSEFLTATVSACLAAAHR
ncbi:MAG: LysR family transcriptional regulator [Kofleriaceae bacterium]|nr:LysR family transcriptional regulator [Kofleriaceae bacterium]